MHLINKKLVAALKLINEAAEMAGQCVGSYSACMGRRGFGRVSSRARVCNGAPG